jgi:non-specific serine/threonine protein kinase
LSSLAIALTPVGHLVVEEGDSHEALPAAAARRISKAFARGSGEGLLHLGASEVRTPLPPTLAFWRDVGRAFVTALCALPDLEAERERADPRPRPGELERLAVSRPPMRGGEYVTAAVLDALWREIGRAWRAELAAWSGTVDAWLSSRDPGWSAVGRVHLHVAENRRDAERPFAFLATYTTGLAPNGKPLHRPLGDAVRAASTAADRQRLLALLRPVHRASERSALVRELAESGRLFQPQAWTPSDAHRFLTEVPALEESGVVVRVPAWWSGQRPPRPRITITMGDERPAGLGLDAVLDFDPRLTLGDEELSEAALRELLDSREPLVLFKGRWVEVDRERLAELMRRWLVARQGAAEGVSFIEALRLLAGADLEIERGEVAAAADREWVGVRPGAWLAGTLASLRGDAEEAADPGPALRTTLRPYQRDGVRWLAALTRLGLGGCLADDMGLGKTVQVLALFLLLQRRGGPGAPHLLVAPASLLANWKAEAERFAPSLRVLVAHPSALSGEELSALGPDAAAACDVVVVSYGWVRRLAWLADMRFGLVVLDEAQAIKNPAARQTRAVKALHSHARIALTGTPVENRASDLWSIFDFLDPGLLGSAKAFGAFIRSANASARRPDAPPMTDGAGAPSPYAALRALIRPYLLRRLKTDPAVIADLPEKTEVRAWCALARPQVALYAETVESLRRELATVAEAGDPTRRRGLVLASLLRLKQICNHPSQWLGDGSYAPDASGKFARLAEIAEVIGSRQEKALVFTQFREVTEPLARFLERVFGRPGLVLHGATRVRDRAALVRRFQEDEAVPFMVLSLKAGGTGLNLTAASHVVHFDRWWNPAVENQATDRAYRIGQAKGVLVHKLVCRGTIEERIDAMLEDKRSLSRELIEGGEELRLTELDDGELLRLVSLDLKASALLA